MVIKKALKVEILKNFILYRFLVYLDFALRIRKPFTLKVYNISLCIYN